MKNLLLFFCLFCSATAFAQDQITLKNGNTKSAKIISVNEKWMVVRYPDEKSKVTHNIPMSSIETYSVSTIPKYNDTIPKYEVKYTIEREIYCQIIAFEVNSNNSRSNIRIDYGFEEINKADLDKAIIASIDDGRGFKSIADVLNYMSLAKGWTLVSSHSIHNDFNTYQYFIMKKTVTLIPEKQE